MSGLKQAEADATIRRSSKHSTKRKVNGAEANSEKATGAFSEKTALKPDTNAAIAFLRRWAPEGPWVLTAIQPNGKTPTNTFAPSSEVAARKFIDDHQGKSNLYFSVNSPQRDSVQKKMKKEDIGVCVAFHVDVDPKKGKDVQAERASILDRLGKHEPRPSALIDSGGGYQAFWMLADPIKIETEGDVKRIEAYNRAIEKRLTGGTQCWNIDRVMRLPGTINVLNATKVKAGRKPAITALVWAEDARYSPDDFDELLEDDSSEDVTASSESGEGETFDEEDHADQLKGLPAGVADWCRRVIINGYDPDNHDRYGGKDRSAAVYAVLCELCRVNCPHEVASRIVLDRRNHISDHIYDQAAKPEDVFDRQWKRAAKKVASEFQTGKGGKPLADSQRNCRLALSKMSVTLSYDEFVDRPMIEGPETRSRRTMGDNDMIELRMLIDSRFSFRPTSDFMKDFLINESRAQSFHPVRQYLDGLTWDGVKRLDAWLTTYLGVEDTEFSRAVGRKWMVAAVKRVRQPGCQFDEMIVLEGKQGSLKSTLLRTMAVNDEWFSDSMHMDADSKEVIEQTSGKWIVEISELNGMRRSDVEKVKALVSRRVDTARMAYGRFPKDRPREFIFSATTNGEEYLTDITGNRRYWPVRVGEIKLDDVRRDLDQLWAEAAQAERDGESIRLPEKLWSAAAEEQEKRREPDPWEESLGRALGNLKGFVPTTELWGVVGIYLEKDKTPQAGSRIARAMRALGWERGRWKGRQEEIDRDTRGYKRGSAKEVSKVLKLNFERLDVSSKVQWS